MNRIYRLVFNRALGQIQVASELSHASSGGARTLPAPACLRVAMLALACALASNAHAASSLPTGFSIGTGTIDQSTSTDGLTMTLTQTGNKALINWSDFSIGSGYTVDFAQDSASAVTLNVVTGTAISEIYGNLTADGGVFLINPKGILFGNEAQVNVGSLVATTLALTEDDGTNYEFTKSGSTAPLINYGQIQTSSGGSVTLLAPTMVNTGTIDAGSIALLAADKATLTYEPGLGVSATLQTSVTDLGAASIAINTSGTLSADSVTLRSIVQSGLLNTAINMGGTVSASSLAVGTYGSGALVSTANVSADYMSAYSSGAFTQDGGKLAVDALDLSVTGAAMLQAEENAISTLQGTVGGVLALTNTTALGQDYELIVGGATTIDNGAADITLTNAGNAFSSQVNLTGGAIAVTSGSALNIGGLSADGEVALSGSTLGLTSAIDTGSHALSLSATSGALTTSVDLAGGAVSLYGAGGISLGADVTASTLTLGSANANITQNDGMLDVDGSTTVSAGSGNIALTETTNQFGGAVTATGNDVTLATNGALLLGDNDIGGTFSAYGGSSIAQVNDTSLEIDGASDFSSNGNITLTNSDNVFGGAVDLDGAALSVSTAQELTVGSVSAGGDVALSGSTVGLTSALDTGTHALSLTSSSGVLAIDQSVDAGALTLYGNSGVTLNSDVSAQSLTLGSSNAAISQVGGSLSVSGATTASAGSGAVTLDSAGNTFGGTVALTGGALTVAAAGTLTLGEVSGSSLAASADTIALTGDVGTSGGQTYSGALDVDDSATLSSSAGGDLVFTGAIGGDGALAMSTTGAVEIDGNVDLLGDLQVEAGSVSAQAITLGGDLDLSTSSAISQNGAYAITGDARFNANGYDITLLNGGNSFGSVALNGGNVAIAGAGLAFAASTIDGYLIATSTDGISQTGALNVGSTSNLSASGDITLENADNVFAGAVELSSGGDVRLASDASLHVASASASDALDLAAAQLTTSGTLQGNAVTLRGDGGITMGGDVSAQSLALGSSNAAISQSAGSIAVAGATTVDAGTGAVALDSAGNTFGGTVTLTGGALTVAAAGTLTLGEVSGSSLAASADTIALTGDVGTSGGQTYSGALDVDDSTTLSSSAGGDLVVTGAIGGDGALAMSTTGAVAIGGDVDLQGSLDVDAASFSAQAISLGGDLALSTTSAIGQNGAYSVDGTTTVDTGGNAITLTNAGNQFGGDVSLSGGSVAIRNAGNLSLASVDASSLDAGSGGTLSTGTLDVTGNATLDGAGLSLGSTSVGGTLTATSSAGIGQTAALAVDGASSFAASGDIDLDDASNRFDGAVTLSGADVTVASNAALSVAGVSASGDVDLDARSLTSTGTISGQAVDLRGSNGINLGGNVSAQSLTLGSSNAAISQSAGSIAVAGATTVDAGTGAVTLGQSGNSFGGTVALTGGALAINADGGLALGSVTGSSLSATADTITLASDISTSGSQSYTGDVSVGSDVALTSTGGGALNVNGDIGGSGSVAMSSTGAVAIGGDVALQGSLDVDAASFSAQAISLGGDLALSTSSAVGQNGAYSVDGTTTIDAGGNAITLTNAGNQFGGDVSLSGGTVAIRNAGNLSLASVDASSLDAGSTGTLSTGTLEVTGNAILDGAGLSLGSTSVGGTLTATSSGDIGQTAALAVDGASSFVADGDIDLDNAGNRFGGTVALTGGALAINADGDLALGTVSGSSLSAAADTIALGSSISTAGSQSYTGDVSVDSSVALAGSSLGFSGDIGGSGSLALTSTGAVAIGGDVDLQGSLDVDAASFSAHAISLGGDLDLSTSSAVGQNGAYVVAGTTTVDAGGNAISLTNAGNQFGGGVSLSGGTVAIRNAGNLSLASVDASSLDAGSSGALSTGTLDVTGNAILDGAGLSLGSTSVGGTLTATSSAGIGQTAALAVDGASSFAASGDIDLDNAGNRFGGTVALTGGALAINADGGLALGTVSGSSLSATADTITLASNISTTGSQSYTGDVSVGSDVALTSTGGGALNVNGDIGGSGSLAMTSTGAVAIGGDVDLQGSLAVDAATFSAQAISLGGDLALSTTSAVGQNGAYSIDGATTVDAGGNAITLTNAGNQFGGDVSLSGGTVAIRNAGNLSLASVDASSLDAGSSGTLSTGVLDVTGNAILDGAGLSLGSTSVGGTLTATSSAGITQTAALAVDGASSFAASGDIALTDGSNRFGGAVTLDGAAVAIAAGSALDLASVDADSLDASAAGALTLGGARIAGDASLGGAGIALGSTTVGGDLQASSSAAISQSAALTVAGATTLAANGAVLLDRADNDFQGAVSVAASQVALADANDLQIASISGAGIGGSISAASVQRSAATTTASSGGVSLVAGGSLSLDGAIHAGSGDLVLASSGGSLTTSAALSGGNVSLSGRDGLTLGSDVSASGTLALNSDGAISQTGGVLSAATLTGSAGGSATLDGDNQIATLGDFSATALSLGNARSLDVTGAVDAGSSLLLDVRSGDLAIDGSLSADAVRLQSAGAINEGGNGRIVASTLSGRSAGATMLGDGGTFAANQVQTLGDFRALGGFSMTNAATLTLASLNGSSFSVDAGTAAFFLKVDGGDLLQRGTTAVHAGRGTWWSSGHIGTADAPIYVVTSDTTQVVEHIGLPPAYFYALGRSGSPVVIGGAINLPTSALATRAQSGSLKRVAYVDMGALNAEYRPFGIVQPGIRLPADQQPACDAGDPDAGCAQ